MAFYISGFDESSARGFRGQFYYGGWAGSVDTWDKDFAPAWAERVLKRNPAIDYLHVSAMFSKKGLAKLKLPADAAEPKLKEAAQVLASTGGLTPITVNVSHSDFNRFLRQDMEIRTSSGSRKKGPVTKLEADYACFVGAALWTMVVMNERHSDIDRIDFWVERKEPLTDYLRIFRNDLKKILPEIGYPEFVPQIGDLIAVPKTRIQAQAADYLLWHVRNAHNGTLDSAGWNRYRRIVDGGGFSPSKNRQRRRFGRAHSIPIEFLKKVSTSLAARVRRAHQRKARRAAKKLSSSRMK